MNISLSELLRSKSFDEIAGQDKIIA